MLQSSHFYNPLPTSCGHSPGRPPARPGSRLYGVTGQSEEGLGPGRNDDTSCLSGAGLDSCLRKRLASHQWLRHPRTADTLQTGSRAPEPKQQLLHRHVVSLWAEELNRLTHSQGPISAKLLYLHDRLMTDTSATGLE